MVLAGQVVPGQVVPAGAVKVDLLPVNRVEVSAANRDEANRDEAKTGATKGPADERDSRGDSTPARLQRPEPIAADRQRADKRRDSGRMATCGRVVRWTTGSGTAGLVVAGSET